MHGRGLAQVPARLLNPLHNLSRQPKTCHPERSVALFSPSAKRRRDAQRGICSHNRSFERKSAHNHERLIQKGCSLRSCGNYLRVSSLPTKMLLSEPQKPRFFLAGWFACSGCGCGTAGVCPSARRMSAANSGAATRPENSHSGSTRATRTSNAVSAAGSAGRNGDGTTDTTSGCTINVYATVTSGGPDGGAKFDADATGCISFARASSPISTRYLGAAGSATATFNGATAGCICDTTGATTGTGGMFCAISGRDGSIRTGAGGGDEGATRVNCATHSQLPGAPTTGTRFPPSRKNSPACGTIKPSPLNCCSRRTAPPVETTQSESFKSRPTFTSRTAPPK